MTEPAPIEAAPAQTLHRARWDAARGGLAVAWLLLVVIGYLAAEEPASWDELRAAVAQGEVERVTLTDSEQPRTPRLSGLEVHWDGHVTQLTKRQLHDLEDSVVEVQRDWETGWQVSMDDIRGWEVPDWVEWAALGLGLATLVLLIRAPAPWHATRWAWFWVLAAMPWLGVPLFLAFAGPTPLVSQRAVRPWLTGGWAFLLAIALGAALDSTF